MRQLGEASSCFGRRRLGSMRWRTSLFSWLSKPRHGDAPRMAVLMPVHRIFTMRQTDGLDRFVALRTGGRVQHLSGVVFDQ